MYTGQTQTNYNDVGSGILIQSRDNEVCRIYVKSASNILFNPMIRTAIDDSEFVPYNPNLPEAIYGSELDVLTGKLTVTHVEVDLGDLEWSYDSTNARFSAFISTKKQPASNRTEPLVCSCYYAITDGRGVSEVPDGSIYSVTSSYRIYIHDSRYTDATAFKTAVTGQTLVYELAEPYTIQLTPQQVRLLKGTNNLSCNTGDLSIKYYPDNVLGQLKGDIEKGLNAYYDYQIQALWDKIGELQG